jgi:hypothetical protein
MGHISNTMSEIVFDGSLTVLVEAIKIYNSLFDIGNLSLYRGILTTASISTIKTQPQL